MFSKLWWTTAHLWQANLEGHFLWTLDATAEAMVKSIKKCCELIKPIWNDLTTSSKHSRWAHDGTTSLWLFKSEWLLFAKLLANGLTWFLNMWCLVLPSSTKSNDDVSFFSAVAGRECLHTCHQMGSDASATLLCVGQPQSLVWESYETGSHFMFNFDNFVGQ